MRLSLTKIVHRALRMKGLYTDLESGKDSSTGPDRAMNVVLYAILHPIRAYRSIKKIRKRDYNNHARITRNSLYSNPSSQSLYSPNVEQKAS